jgi:hypothetical protein
MDLGMKMINYNAYTLQIRRVVNYGELQPDVWASIQPGYIKAGIVKDKIDPSTFLDTSFQKGVAEVTTEYVKEGIDKWKEANPDKVIN